MYPEISEFSFAFALTQELANSSPSKFCPVFPTTNEEAKLGYDVQLDAGGIITLIQFKRSEKITRNRGGYSLNCPFYRFQIRESYRSRQHTTLCDLEAEWPSVFYAAPLFDTTRKLSEYYTTSQIRANTAMIRPNQIGPLPVGAAHKINFTSGTKFEIRSEAKTAEGLIRGDSLNHVVRDDFDRIAARHEIRERRIGLVSDAFLESAGRVQQRQVSALRRVVLQKYPDADPGLRSLLLAAEIAIAVFGCQLFIVQNL